MEERRLLVAVALSFLVLAAYRLYFVQPAPLPERSAATTGEPVAAAPETGPSSPALAAAPKPAPEPVASVADVRERRVEVVSPDLVLGFANRGARLVSWRVTGYRDARGNPEELVQASRAAVRPLDLETGDPNLDARLREALFRASSESVSVAASGQTELRFEYSEGDLVATKRFVFEPRGHVVSITASVEKGGRVVPSRILWGPGVGNPSDAERSVQGYLRPQAVVLSSAGVERLPAEKIGAGRQLPDGRFVGIETQYFAALLVPAGGRGKVEVRAVEGTTAGGEADLAPVVTAETGPGPLLLYVGPKDHAALKRVGHGLEMVVDVGAWLGPIVIGFMRVLSYLQGLVGNYGGAILVLTVLINLAMAPLRHAGIVNGMKMQKIGPEMKAIQERYRKYPALDPRRQEMTKELQALYGRHGMNMGTQAIFGCLPLLLTMPFLFAIYTVLQVAIELRGAPFLWIPDLSHKDPLFVTPVLMGLSMFAMQKMTPSTLDPAQQRMMMIMPLVLTTMFFAAPAGLNLYWLASNACFLVQQGTTLSLLRAREAAHARGKEKRK